MPTTKATAIDNLRATAAEIEKAIISNKLERERINTETRARLLANREDRTRLLNGRSKTESLIEWFENYPDDDDQDVDDINLISILGGGDEQPAIGGRRSAANDDQTTIRGRRGQG